VNADDLQIKMAQGAKRLVPAPGAQGLKYIAKVRHGAGSSAAAAPQYLFDRRPASSSTTSRT
jgi:glutamate synthase domain-containing protein 2